MTDAVIASGVVAAVVLGFGAQNHAMLATGAERSLRLVADGMVASLSGGLMLFAVALAGLHLLPSWVSSVSMVLASLLIAMAGLARYLADPGAPAQDAPEANIAALSLQHLRSPESWAVAVFLAGSALSGSMTLAMAFAGLTLLSAIGLSLWAMAGWSGCAYLTYGWHRRHLDWTVGILMFVAAMTSLVPGA